MLFFIIFLSDNQIWQIELSVALFSWKMNFECKEIERTRDEMMKQKLLGFVQHRWYWWKTNKWWSIKKERKKQRRSDKSDIFASTPRLYTRVFHYLLDYTIVISSRKKCLHRWRQTRVIYIRPSRLDILLIVYTDTSIRHVWLLFSFCFYSSSMSNQMRMG